MERATQERLTGATLLIIAGVILIPWLLDGSMTEPGVREQELVLPGSQESGNETRRISLEVPRQDGSTSGSVAEIDSRTVRSVDEPPMTLPAPKSSEPSQSEAPARFAKPMPAAEEPADPKPAEVAAIPRSDPPRDTASGGESATTAPSSGSNSAASASQEAVASPPPQVAEPAPKEPVVSSPAPSRAEPATAKVWAVQVGSFASQQNAERLAELLRTKSYKAFVMRNVLDGRVLFRVRVGPVNSRNEADLLAAALREDRQPARIVAHP